MLRSHSSGASSLPPGRQGADRSATRNALAERCGWLQSAIDKGSTGRDAVGTARITMRRSMTPGTDRRYGLQPTSSVVLRLENAANGWTDRQLGGASFRQGVRPLAAARAPAVAPVCCERNSRRRCPMASISKRDEIRRINPVRVLVTPAARSTASPALLPLVVTRVL